MSASRVTSKRNLHGAQATVHTRAATAAYGTDRQTDGRTGKTRNAAFNAVLGKVRCHWTSLDTMLAYTLLGLETCPITRTQQNSLKYAFRKLTSINRLIWNNFYSQSQTPRKLYNSTTGNWYLLWTKAKSEEAIGQFRKRLASDIATKGSCQVEHFLISCRNTVHVLHYFFAFVWCKRAKIKTKCFTFPAPACSYAIRQQLAIDRATARAAVDPRWWLFGGVAAEMPAGLSNALPVRGASEAWPTHARRSTLFR